MHKLDVIDLDILSMLVDNELMRIDNEEIKTDKQCEFELRVLKHKIEVLRRGSERIWWVKRNMNLI